MSDDDNRKPPAIVSILPPFKPSEIQRAAANYAKNEKAITEYYVVYARVQAARFKALRAQGFTIAQALELCKTS